MPVSAEYDVGQLVSVTDRVMVGAALTDPAQLKIKVKDPAGNVTSDTWPGGTGLIVHDGVGLFHAAVDTTYVVATGAGGAGVWRVRYWTPTGQAGQHATDYEFIVRDSPLK